MEKLIYTYIALAIIPTMIYCISLTSQDAKEKTHAKTSNSNTLKIESIAK